MTGSALRVADYLLHFRQAIERIQQYTQGMDEEAFLHSVLVQDAVIRNIEILGQAANNKINNPAQRGGVFITVPLAAHCGVAGTPAPDS